MNKADFDLLGKVFNAEIDGLLCYQGKSKRLILLEEQGMVCRFEQPIKCNDGLPPMIVKGWVLTPKGHFEYCSACEEYCSEDIGEL